jgi:leucyl-tRNA synthetase
METLNDLNKIDNAEIFTEGYWVITNVLEPIVPHIATEIADNLFKRANFGVIEIDEDALKDDEITMAVTVNGKKRAEITVAPNTDKEKLVEIAKVAVEKQIEGKQIIKEIVVPNKLVNIVVKG